MIREVSVEKITQEVAKLCIEANKHLPCDIEKCISDCAKQESNPLARSILNDLTENITAANENDLPILLHKYHTQSNESIIYYCFVYNMCFAILKVTD